VNFNEDDPIDPKALWLNSQHLRTELACAGAAVPNGGGSLRHTVDVIRSRVFTLKDFADDFRIEPDALEKLDKPGARRESRTTD